MKTNQLKRETLSLIDVMIDQANCGPSGFWTDDYEGCGNPLIFPEFDEGLKHGKNVSKKHYLCPWDTDLLFGSRKGCSSSGCYHRCSIREARFLPTELLKTVLERFKDNVISGKYDNEGPIEPLLTPDDKAVLEKEKERIRVEKETEDNRRQQERVRKASKLLEKYAEDEEAVGLISAHYGEKTSIQTYDHGILFFDPESMSDIVGGEKLSYDDYLDAQLKSSKDSRFYFLRCYHEAVPLEFKGRIEKITKDNVCFKRIYISGMFFDGVCFDGREDHVWMCKDAFGDCSVGDAFSFSAEVYRYLKKGDGKSIDYGLRNPESIKKIDDYELPSDEELQAQEMQSIICETCYLSEHCNRFDCILNPPKKKRRNRKKEEGKTEQ